MNHTPLARRVFVASLLLLAPATRAVAQQPVTWSGLAANNLWSTAGNWQGNVAPIGNATTAVVLTGTAQTTNVMDLGGFQLNSLTFAAEAGPFTINQMSGGNYFNFLPAPSGTLPHVDQFSAAAQAINFPNTGLQLNGVVLLFGGTGAGSLTITGQVVGTGRVVLNGPYVVTLNATLGYTNSGLTVNAGTLRMNNDLAFGSGALTFGGGTLQLINNLAVTRPVVVNAGGGTIDANGFTASINGSNVTVTGPGRLTLTNTSGTGVTNFGSQLQHTGGLLVTGANNTVTLTGNNSYTGGTTLSGGATLVIDSNFRLGNAGDGVTLDGGTLRLVYPSGYNTSHPFTLGPGGGTISIDSTVAPTGFGAAIGGSGGLTKTGTGVISLRAANTYSGPTTVAGGTLQVLHNQSLQNSTVVLAGGVLQFLNPATAPVVGGLAGSGGLAFSGPSSLAVGNNNASITFGGSLSGSFPGGLAKVGTGAWTLTGTNTQSGPFNIQAGSVVVGSATALSPNAPVTVSTGAAVDLNGFNYTVPAASPLTVRGELRFNGAAVAVAAGGTATYDGTALGNGILRGPGTHVVTGGSVLTGVTTFNNTVVNATGPAGFRNFTNGGSFTAAAGPAATVTLDGFSNEGSGTVAVAANGQVNAADFQSYGVVTIAPGLAGAPATQVTNTGMTPLYFNGGSRTFVGTPQTASTPTANVDLNGKDAIVAGGLFVNNGVVFDNSNGTFTGAGKLVADFGALIKGAGSYVNTPVTQNGGRFQAGNSPGVARHGSLTLGPGKLQNDTFQINNVVGAAGPTPDAGNQVSGWTLHDVATEIGLVTGLPGDFAWMADPTNRETITMQTLLNPTTSGIDNFGPMANFDPSQNYAWPFVRWAGTYSGPTSDAELTAATIFDATGFQNATNGGAFGWHLDTAARTLSLTFTAAVPEPGTLALVGGAALVGVWRVRKRR